MKLHVLDEVKLGRFPIFWGENLALIWNLNRVDFSALVLRFEQKKNEQKTPIQRKVISILLPEFDALAPLPCVRPYRNGVLAGIGRSGRFCECRTAFLSQ